MESRLKTVIDKVDIFNEDEFGYSFDESCGPDDYSAMKICLKEAEIYQIAEYAKHQQFLEKKLASLHKDVEFQSTEKDGLTRKKDELAKAHDEMTKKLKNLKSELSHHHETRTTELPGVLKISNLLHLITNLEWNVKACTDSKTEGHLVSRSVLKPFSFEVNTHQPHDVQEKLWEILHDDEFAQSLDT